MYISFVICKIIDYSLIMVWKENAKEVKAQ